MVTPLLVATKILHIVHMYLYVSLHCNYFAVMYVISKSEIVYVKKLQTIPFSGNNSTIDGTVNIAIGGATCIKMNTTEPNNILKISVSY